MSRSFTGQFIGERLLFRRRMTLVSFLLKNIMGITLTIGTCLIAWFIFHAFSLHWLSYLIPAFVCALYGSYLWLLYHKTYLIITSERIQSSERTGLFEFRRREIRLENIKETVTKKGSVFEMMFRFGTLVVRGLDYHEEIEFYGLHQAEQVRNYVSKLMSNYRSFGDVNSIGEFDLGYDSKEPVEPTYLARKVRELDQDRSN